MNNLIVLVNYGKEEVGQSIQLLKLNASTMLRTFCEADLLLVHHSLHPAFLVERKGVFEWILDFSDVEGESKQNSSKLLFVSIKEAIQTLGLSLEFYERIVLMDSSCLCQRNIDHLFASEADIQWLPVRKKVVTEDAFNFCLGGISENQLNRYGSSMSLLSIKSSCFSEVMSHWLDIALPYSVLDDDEQLPLLQGAWNRLLIETNLSTEAFERREVQFPLWIDSEFLSYRDAAVLCGDGGELEDRLSFNFGRYMDIFFRDKQGTFLNFLEL